MNYPSKIYARLTTDGCILFSLSPSDGWKEYEMVAQNEVADDDVMRIVDAWRSLPALQQFRKVDQTIRGAIKKALSQFTIDDVISAINNYATVLSDKDYYLNYTWDIRKFFSQKNALPDYLTDGVKWVNYCKDKDKRADRIVPWSKLDVFTQDDILNATRLYCKNFRVPNADVQRTLSILYDVYPLVFASMCKQKKTYLDVNIKNEYGAGFFTMKFDSVIFLSPGGAITKTVKFEQELKKYQ